MQFDKQPVNSVKWIHLDKVIANEYNPNSVAKNEMKLLYLSIKNDGYTQPVVTIYDKDNDKYVIVDGFHRYLVMRTYKEIFDRTGGKLPIVVIEKDINDRMASTIRHNRARGKHSVDGMANMVFNMLDKGWEDSKICMELGLEKEELVRIKHVTGFSKLFGDVNYKKAWKTRKQLQLRKEWEQKTRDNEVI